MQVAKFSPCFLVVVENLTHPASLGPALCSATVYVGIHFTLVWQEWIQVEVSWFSAVFRLSHIQWKPEWFNLKFSLNRSKCNVIRLKWYLGTQHEHNSCQLFIECCLILFLRILETAQINICKKVKELRWLIAVTNPLESLPLGCQLQWPSGLWPHHLLLEFLHSFQRTARFCPGRKIHYLLHNVHVYHPLVFVMCECTSEY